MRRLGLYLDPPYLSLGVVETRGKRVIIHSIKSLIPLTAENVKQLYIRETPHHVAVAIPTLVRTLHLTVSSPKQIARILPFQVESISSLPSQDIAYTTLLHPAKSGPEATIFLTSKEFLKKNLIDWSNYGLVPDLVCATFSALNNFSLHFIPTLSSLFIIDLGSQKWNCVWMENNKIKKGFTIEFGIENLLAALWEDVKKVLFSKEIEGVASQMNLLQFKPHSHPHLSKKLEEARNSLANVLYSFQKESGPKPVFFTGRIDAFMNFREYLLEPIPDLSLWQSEDISLDAQKGAIAIGSALERKTQFLTGEFTPRKTWEKTGIWSVLLMLFSITISISLILGSRKKLESEKETLASSFKEILLQSDKNLADSLFVADLEKGLEEAAFAIQKYDKETPYILQTSNVTELLGWLSSHPLLQALQKSNDPIEIRDVKYQLISFPHIDAMQEKYRAKVELEFSSKSSMNARKFHEALLQGDEFVNEQEELTWDSSGDIYRTSFFLNNKGSHAS